MCACHLSTQESHTFEARLGYILRPVSKEMKTKKINKRSFLASSRTKLSGKHKTSRAGDVAQRHIPGTWTSPGPFHGDHVHAGSEMEPQEGHGDANREPSHTGQRWVCGRLHLIHHVYNVSVMET